jgi:hypothetical protein
MSYVTFPTVQTIINGVSQDVRTQLSANPATAGQPILIDYVNRTHKQMLRFSRWRFLNSEPLFFLTQKGQSVYWLGPKGQGPAGSVDTGLNLQDVQNIKKDSVVDLSNQKPLKWLSASPSGPNLLDRAGAGRPGLPSVFVHNPNDPNILFLYPPPDNQNTSQPVPQPPVVTTQSGGALPLRTYLIKITLVDQLGGESTAATTGSPIFVLGNNLAVVKSPAYGIFGQVPDESTVTGNQYNQYNVYAVQAILNPNGTVTNEGSETLQNASPIAIGTDWVEPTSGLITTGKSVPKVNTLQPVGAYVIKFEYFKNRINLNAVSQFLQIPDDYQDIVIQGVTYFAWRILGKLQEAQLCYQEYRRGLSEMVQDKNLFPEGVEFIRPDTNSYVNTQILGYLDPFF